MNFLTSQTKIILLAVVLLLITGALPISVYSSQEFQPQFVDEFQYINENWQLREFDRYYEYEPDIIFSKSDEGNLKIDSFTNGYGSLGIGYAFIELPKSLLDGKKVSITWRGYFTHWETRTIGSFYLFNGTFSNNDITTYMKPNLDKEGIFDFKYINLATYPCEAAGWCEWRTDTSSALDLTEYNNKVTLLVRLVDAWIQQKVILEIKKIDILNPDGTVFKTFDFKKGNVLMELTDTLNDYGFYVNPKKYELDLSYEQKQQLSQEKSAKPSTTFSVVIGDDELDVGNSIVQTIYGDFVIVGDTRSFSQGGQDIYVAKLDTIGNIQWAKTIGGDKWEEGNSIIQTSDGGFAIAGSTNSFGQGSFDVYIIKLDADGNLQWTKTIGGEKWDEGRSIVQTSDGGFAIAGSTYSFGQGKSDVYIIKLDNNGNLQWTKTIGGKKWDEGRSIIQTHDGGFAIAGSTNSFGQGSFDVYIIKLDNNGNLQWTKTIGGKSWNEGKSIIQTHDGGFAIAGSTNSFDYDSFDAYIIKLDANGNLQWYQIVGGKEWDEGNSIIQTADGGFVVAGSTYSFDQGHTDVYVIKLYNTGSIHWTKTIGGDKYDWGRFIIQTKNGSLAIIGYTESFSRSEADIYIIKLDPTIIQSIKKDEGNDEGNSIIQTSDGGFAIAGSTNSFDLSRTDVYIIKLDANGKLQWSKTVGGKYWDEGKSIIQTHDGGFAIVGFTGSLGHGNDVYVIKLDNNGNLQWTKTVGGKKWDEGKSIIQTHDGGFAITGFTESFGQGDLDVYVVRLDKNGNLKWTKTIGGRNWEKGNSIIQTTDGGFAITGFAGPFMQGEYDVYVVKLDNNGDLQWTKKIGGIGRDEGKSIIQTRDGGFAIAGYTESFTQGEYDVYVVKLDNNGDLQWTKKIGGIARDEGRSIIQTHDGGFAIVGFTYSFGRGKSDIYLIKLDSNGNLQWTKTIGGDSL